MKKKIGGLSVFIEGDKKNRAILFLHGFPYDHHIWDTQIEALKEEYYCISYDIKGLGLSSVGDGQFTMESFVDDLENIIEALELDKPILCGHSMGGYICLRALTRMQEKFSAAILCNTVSHADSDEKKIDRSEAISRINANGIRAFVKSFITRCFGEVYKKKQKEALKQRIDKSSVFNSVGVKGCILAMMGRTDTTKDLENFTVPVLLIAGESDALTPPSIMQTMSQRIKGSQFVIIEQSAHMSMLENPEAVNAAVKAFVQGI